MSGSEESTRSMTRGMLGDLDDFDGAKVSVGHLSSRLKAWLALLEGTRADQAWIDELRSLRNEVEVVSAFFVESGRSELLEDERRQLGAIIVHLREALVAHQ